MQVNLSRWDQVQSLKHKQAPPLAHVCGKVGKGRHKINTENGISVQKVQLIKKKINRIAHDYLHKKLSLSIVKFCSF